MIGLCNATHQSRTPTVLYNPYWSFLTGAPEEGRLRGVTVWWGGMNYAHLSLAAK